MATHRIRILASDVSLVRAFYNAVQALDEIISPTSHQQQHLAVAGDFEIDMSQWLDLYSLGPIDVLGFAAAHQLEADLGVVMLLDTTDEAVLNTANRVYQAVRNHAHIPTLVAAHCADMESEDITRFGVDLLLDEDPVFCYDDFSAESVRQMLIRLLDEVVLVRDEYALEANDLLSMLLDED